MLRRYGSKGRVGHIDEVPVLVLAVHAGQAAAAHLCVVVAQGLVLTVHIAGIPEIELQRVVVILAEIHQRVHFLVGEGVFRHHSALGIGHTGTVAGNDVIRPDAAQLLPVHARKARPPISPRAPSFPFPPPRPPHISKFFFFFFFFFFF